MPKPTDEKMDLGESHEGDGRLLDDLRVVLDRQAARQSPPDQRTEARKPATWRFAHYEVRKLLGEGGMARVYEAMDTVNGTAVALKILRKELWTSADIRARFEEEARSMSRIEHANVVRVYESPTHRGATAIVMELLRGGSLGDLLKARTKQARRISVRSLCRFALEAAEGLGAAHVAGIVHRDVKPSNLMLDADRKLKVVDFGVVLAVERATWLTGLGRPIGTPAYMSPEQCNGTRVGPASDVYAFGVAFFELATGRLPFVEDGGSPFAVMLMHIRQPPPDPRNYRPDLPDWFAGILLRCLEKDPRNRFSDGNELAEALRAGPQQAARVTINVEGPSVATRLNTVAIREQLKRLPQRAIVAWACRCARRALMFNRDPRLLRSIETAEATLHDGGTTPAGSDSLSHALLRIQQLRSASFSVADAAELSSSNDSASCAALAAAATCACAAARCAADAAADAAFVAEKAIQANVLAGRPAADVWRHAQDDYRVLLTAKLGEEGSVGAAISAGFWDARA